MTESPLLHTKLRVPDPIHPVLSRPRLIRQLSLEPNGILTLLSAPAGFGKTTAITDWIQHQSNPTVWLTLDEQDNDPILFWRYIIAAFQSVDPCLGRRALAALLGLAQSSLEMVVTLLINDIDTNTAPETIMNLVLDDFHWIHAAAVHQSFNSLLQHQPKQLHLVLLTRADPPLSLARLRVEGRLRELRAADLSFTEPEMTTFLSEIMALDIEEEALALLAEQTEGWPAGLQLAALSLRQRGATAVTRLVQTLAGMRQHVFAYLMEEVLSRQPDEVRHFLQQTAVLRQFCASLCTAVTGQIDAAHVLRRLTSDNLFITPLDDEGQWYRYHPLFAEMLRANLDEATRRECHRRAAHWYAQQQLPHDAIRNAHAAQDYELMAALLVQWYKNFLAQGLLVSVQKWLSALPPNFQSPRLRLASAWARVYESNEQELEQVAAELGALPRLDAPLRGELLAVQAIYASLYGQPGDALQRATEALKLIAAEDFLSLAAAYQALGNAYRSQGELDAALAAFAQARRQFDAMGNVFMSQLPLFRMAHIQIMQGRLHQALQTYEMVRRRAQAAGHEPLVVSGEVFGYLSDLYGEWNELDRALAYARQEIDLAQSGHMLWPLVDGYLKLAEATAAQGNADAAREALGLAAETAIQLQSAPVSAQVALYTARHELIWGNLAAAAAWAEKYVSQRASKACVLTPLLAQSADLLLARVWLAQGRTEAVMELLQDAVHQFEAAGRARLIVEANLLRALTYAAQGQDAAVQKSLIRALALAKPEGYFRVFVENGPALVPLLKQVRHLFPDYVCKLLSAFPSGGAGGNQEPFLLDPLTQREQEILALIAQGHSNLQIAETLVLSVGTVKGHVNHIFSKLDVRNRTQALLRARELSLVDN